MNSPCIDYRYNLESRACGLLIHQPGPIARAACAYALRAWRSSGSHGPANFERARWFRHHISFVGYPLK